MKNLNLWLAFVYFSLPAFAIIEVGEVVPNMCWQDVNEKKVCLDDYKDTVRVLLYNAGWCGPCNTEFAELVPKVSQFNGKPVTFISLSASGNSQSQPPSTAFLKSWQKKHKIKFVVAASPKDAGKNFIEPPLFIPNVAIISKKGTLSYAAVSPGVTKIVQMTKSLIQ